MNASSCSQRLHTWRTLCAATVLCAALISHHGPLTAAPLSEGSALPELTLNDQHDKPVAIPSGTRWVLIASEKSVSDMVGSVLLAEPAGVMARTGLLYVADISGMPAPITRMFALPKLRKLPFSIALVRESAEVNQVSDFPRRPGAATLLRIENGRVAHLGAVHSAAELRSALGLPPAVQTP
jgi:hypothetical protein